MFKRQAGLGFVAAVISMAGPAYSTGPTLPTEVSVAPDQVEPKMIITEAESQDVIVTRRLLSSGAVIGKPTSRWTVLVPREVEASRLDALGAIEPSASTLPRRLSALVPPAPLDAEVGPARDPGAAPKDEKLAAFPPGFAARKAGTPVLPPAAEESPLADGVYAEQFSISTLVGDDSEPAESLSFSYFEVKAGKRLYLSADEYSERVDGPMDPLLDVDAKPVLAHRGLTLAYSAEMLRSKLPRGEALLELSGNVARPDVPDLSEVNEE